MSGMLATESFATSTISPTDWWEFLFPNLFSNRQAFVPLLVTARQAQCISLYQVHELPTLAAIKVLVNLLVRYSAPDV